MRSASARAPGRLIRNAPEATKGFLLNHLIHELLPPKADGMRWSNSDPITGQAAWYDLRVRIEKAEAGAEISEPHFAAIKPPGSQRQPVDELRYGQEWTAKMTSLPQNRTAKKLGLVIDLDVCVGCHACVISCKEWNTGGYGNALSDQASLWRGCFGYVSQPHPQFRSGRRKAGKLSAKLATRALCIFQSPACTAKTRHV